MKPVENAVIAGRFRLNRLIQSGGMGSVWSATHLGLDIPCAVKFIKGDLVDEQVLSRFEREAKSAAQLRSPHVVQMFEHGVFEGTPYIAMELLDGEDLDTRLRRGPLGGAELHKIMSEVCRALSKAHTLGIVHRDLKPANIFIVKDGDHETTKVLDFGIAKTRSNELGGSTTKTGAMLGTPYYMSPEQAQGTKAVDFRSDLWSLAVIAFLALTGRLPFQSDALGDLLMKIMVAPMPLPSQFGSVPPGFDRWWIKAASREVDERFQSAKAFSDSLALACGVSQVSGIVDQSPVRIKPDTFADATQRDQAVAIPVTKPSGASATGSPGGATPPPLSRSLAAEAPVIPTSKTGLIVVIAIGAVLFATALMGIGWLAFREHEHPAQASASAISSPPAAPSATTAAAAPPASTTPASSESAAAGAPADSTPSVASSTSTRGAGRAGGTTTTGPHGQPTTTTKPSTPSGAPAKPASPAKTSDLGF